VALMATYCRPTWPVCATGAKMRVPKLLALACLVASCASVSIPPKLEVRAAWPRCRGQLCASAPVAPADARFPAPAAAYSREGLPVRALTPGHRAWRWAPTCAASSTSGARASGGCTVRARRVGARGHSLSGRDPRSRGRSWSIASPSSPTTGPLCSSTTRSTRRTRRAGCVRGGAVAGVLTPQQLSINAFADQTAQEFAAHRLGAWGLSGAG